MKEIVIKGIDEKIYYDECDNGLAIYMWVNEKVNNFYATLNVKYGSVDTEFKLKGDKEYKKVTDGIAHFLEHVNFNIDSNTTAHEVFEKLGSSINAFTTFDFTSYEFFASEEFEKNLNSLLDYVQKPYFTKELVEKEKGIICEEVKMGKNSPGQKFYYGVNQAVFKKNKKRNLITGDISDVKKITATELQLVYDNFYHPKNMFLVITGNFNPYEAVGIIKQNQASKEFLDYKNPIKKKIKEPVKVNEKEVLIKANIEIPKVQVCYKMARSLFKDIDDKTLNLYLNMILRNNFGNTSILNEDLMNKELVTMVNANAIVDKDIVLIKINLVTKFPSEVIPIVKDKMNSLTITEEDLKRCRRASIASLINNYDDIEYVNGYLADHIIRYEELPVNSYEICNSINMKEATRLINCINLDNSSTVVMVPFEQNKSTL